MFPLPTPAEFADAEDVLTLNWSNAGQPRKSVKDPAAPGGYACEIPLSPKAKSVIFGYYGAALKNWGKEVKFARGETSGEGYKLFRLAEDTEMVSPHYIYLNGWSVRVWLPSAGLPPDRRDVWINARVMKDGSLRFDRIFLVKNKAK